MGVTKWHELNGDNTLALDWQLTEDSHVWEIGGFEGRWAQQIWDKFHCHITIFEPQMWAVERMEKRFEGIEKIDIRPYGLWVSTTKLEVGAYETDGTSIYSSKEPLARLEFVNFRDEIMDVENVDLALMNIEGAEFTLLPKFIATEAMRKFRYFWCQFHPGVLGSGDYEAAKIFTGIEQTHALLWTCYPTAVAWKRR